MCNASIAMAVVAMNARGAMDVVRSVAVMKWYDAGIAMERVACAARGATETEWRGAADAMAMATS